MSNQTQGRDQFPTDQIALALEALRRPFAADAIRFKIQNQEDTEAPSWAQVVTYIDARLVSERLNHVAAGAWSAQITALAEGIATQERGTVRAVCELTVLGVTRMDVGEGRDPKAAFSDALKRAAVHFGVGRSLYAMKPVFLSADGEGADQLARTRKGKLRIPPSAEAWLRQKYAQWLAGRAQAFGEVLDHGDEAGGVGEDAAELDQGKGTQQTDAAPAGEAQQGHLRVVGQGGPAPAPAPRAQRDAVNGVLAHSGYQDKTLRSLSAFLCDESAVDRLSAAQAQQLRGVVEAAVAAKVTERRLGNAIERAKQFDNAAEGRTQLYEWLLAEAEKQTAKAA